MKLTNGKKKQEVKCGLIDTDGMFLLLLDDNDTRYYRFSDESGLVSDLIKQSDKLRKENSQLKKSSAKLKKDIASLMNDIEKLTVEIVKLKRAKDGS